MNSRLVTLGLFNLGGGEIVLILFFLFVLTVVVIGAFGLIYLIVRAVQNRPPPILASLPPEAVQQQHKRDLEHLNLLSIFHFVFGGLALLGMVFIGLHFLMMHAVFANPDMWKNQRGGPPPQAFFHVFVWFYVFGAIILLTALALNVLSGLFLSRRRHRLFSMIIAGLNCLQIPFGTALGIFTILVLCRESVRELYSVDRP